jgi:proton-coupled amino acid transporter
MPTPPPSKPLNIGSPRSGQGLTRDPRDLLSATPTGAGVSGSPMRPGGIGITSTPPVPNIPRFGTPRATPAFPSPSGPSGLIGAGGSPAGTPGSFTAAGLSTTRPASSLYGAEGTNTPNLDDLPDDEKARVLRRHLMTREEREAAAATAVPEEPVGSRRDSDTSLHLSTYSGALKSRRPSAAVRQDTEAFPVPFEVPGTDVT